MFKNNPFKYDVFISYSRNDHEFVKKLVKKLNKYQPPKGVESTQKYLSVFVDTQDFRGADYHQSISDALKQSRCIIVVCSPAARKSEFVNDEINKFMNAPPGRKPSDIVPIIVDGVPNNEIPASGDQQLRAIPQEIYEHMELPIVQDYRGFTPQSHRIDAGLYHNSWFAMLAGVLDVDRNELEERERKRQIKRRIIVGSIVGAVVSSLSVLGAVALLQREEAVEQRRKAYARQLIAEARTNLASPDSSGQESVRNAIATLTLDPSSSGRETLKAGLNRINPKRIASFDVPSVDGMPMLLSLDPSGRWIVSYMVNSAVIYDVDKNREVARIKAIPISKLPLVLPSISSTSSDGMMQTLAETLQKPFFLQNSQEVVIFNAIDGPKAKRKLINQLKDIEMMVPPLEVITVDLKSGTVRNRCTFNRPMAIATKENEAVYVATLSADGTLIKVWDALENREVVPIKFNGQATRVSLDLLERTAAIVFDHITLGIWNLDSGEQMASFSSTPESPIIEIHAGYNLAITKESEKVFKVHLLTDASRGTSSTSHVVHDHIFIRLVGDGRFVETKGFDSRRHLLDLRSFAKLFSIDDRTREWRIDATEDLERRASIVEYLAPRSGAPTLVTARSDGKISFWEPGMLMGFGTSGMRIGLKESVSLNHGESFRDGPGSAMFPRLSLSSNKKYLISQSGGHKYTKAGAVESFVATVRLWDISQQQVFAQLNPVLGFFKLTFNDEGTRFVTLSPKAPDAQSIPIGSIIANSSGKEKILDLSVWRVPQTAPETKTIRLSKKLSNLVYKDILAPNRFTNCDTESIIIPPVLSPDGESIAWIDRDRGLTIWDAKNGNFTTIDQPEAWICEDKTDDSSPRTFQSMMKFTQNGRHLLVNSLNGVRLYCLDAQKLCYERNFSYPISWSSVSANGNFIGVTMPLISQNEINEIQEKGQLLPKAFATEIWEINRASPRMRIEHDPITRIKAISPLGDKAVLLKLPTQIMDMPIKDIDPMMLSLISMKFEFIDVASKKSVFSAT